MADYSQTHNINPLFKMSKAYKNLPDKTPHLRYRYISIHVHQEHEI